MSLQPLKPSFRSEPAMPGLRNYEQADYQFEILAKRIAEFEKSLDEEHEVAVQLASFGKTVLMQVTGVGFSNPSLIHFYGFIGGNRSELIQHVSQLNFLLTALPKSDPDKPALRIGFVSPEAQENEEDSIEFPSK